EVTTGLLSGGQQLSANAWTGFLLGAGQGELDYRAAALVHHLPGKGGGVIAAVDGRGRLVVRDMAIPGYPEIAASSAEKLREPLTGRRLLLLLDASPRGEEICLNLSVRDLSSGNVVGETLSVDLPARLLVGNLALVSNPGSTSDQASFWFESWRVSGEKLDYDSGRSFGPVLGTMYTVSGGVVKMTVQLPPVGPGHLPIVRLETLNHSEEAWNVVSEASVVVPGYTAHLRINDWNAERL
ncbi:MAG: hypothetical protein ACWGQW_04680, partial [bacterium]